LTATSELDRGRAGLVVGERLVVVVVERVLRAWRGDRPLALVFATNGFVGPRGSGFNPDDGVSTASARERPFVGDCCFALESPCLTRVDVALTVIGPSMLGLARVEAVPTVTGPSILRLASAKGD